MANCWKGLKSFWSDLKVSSDVGKPEVGSKNNFQQLIAHSSKLIVKK